MDTKKLRQKILDLAIHGKLVPQDPNDEPASVLLERIRAEKERLIAEGKIKRSKKSATSDTSHYENVPFDVPEGWCWCRLDTLCDIKGGKRVPRGMSFSDAPTSHVYIRVTNMKKNTIIDNELKYIDDEVFSYIRNYIISKSDLYLTIAGTIGDVGEVPDKYDMMNLTENAAKLTNIICNRKYLMYSLLSSHAQEHFSSKFHQVAQPKLSIETASSTFVPIPPMEEQKRIVAKIEELLTIIDLFDNSKQDLELAILHAKSKILDLAIHGKLVPQDPNDEPASELLKRINPKFVPCDNPHYVGEIPSNWVWTTLGSIGKWQSGGTPSKMHKEYYGGNIPWLKTGDLNDGLVTDIPEHITELGLENSSAKLNPAGSVLIAMYGATIGKVGILGIPATTNQACCACIEYKGITQQYLFLFLLANKANFVAAGGGGAQPNISKEIITKTLIPLPPIEEQHRIVAKVKELFSHLDMIEKSLQA